MGFWMDARKYVKTAMKDSVVRQMDGYWIADIPGFKGVWIDAPTAKEAEKELPSVLNEWLRKKISEGYMDFPWIIPMRLPGRYMYVPGKYVWLTKGSDFIRFPGRPDDDMVPDDMLEYLLNVMGISAEDFMSAYEIGEGD